MKRALAKEHRDFFHKRGWIEFEGFLPDNQLIIANQAIDQVLAERLQTTPNRLPLLNSESLYLHGHDLWRSSPALRRCATQVRLAQVASELVGKTPLRLGYDQLLPSYRQRLFEDSPTSIYAHFLAQTENLASVSCIQGIACGLLLALNEHQATPPDQMAETFDPFPYHSGHVIFFQPQLPIPWNHLYAHPDQRFYLIVYTQASSHYRLQLKDPHTHAFKRLGYVVNDKLNDKLNPIVYR